jgi:hypothetical protein
MRGFTYMKLRTTVLALLLAIPIAPAALAQSELPPVRYNQYGAPQCPTDTDLRNMDVRLSALVVPADNKAALIAERTKAQACRRSGGTYTHRDWERMRAVTNGDS